ncbi:MAG: hypothetical protein AB8F34_04580 [Akkermansiaceae bacterium]
MKKSIASSLMFFLLTLSGGSCVAADATEKVRSPRIVNIVNFIRQNEPRIEWITEDVLYETVVDQIAIMKKHKLRGTFLIQYDTLVDPRYQKLLKELPAAQFEIGTWWEIPQPLVEQSGYKWRGRFAWDWHADVGFSTGYTPTEREKLVDTSMVKFKEIFGYYPKSVGSWFIDAHTLKYMHDKYGVIASCNCKDQIGTDGYTMWGGYWNQAYYPSKKNAYMPAQNAKSQIPVPIFRMLGSDPIHQYDSGLGTTHQRVVSLEPVYTKGGGDEKWCQWYFGEFINGASMGYAYTQVGQENSFTWKRMRKGFEIQMPMIAKLKAEGKVVVKTLGEAGQWFKDNYEVTPPTSVTALSDLSEKNLKTVWFNSRFYRANLLWEKGTLRFRDIHVFDEKVASNYLARKETTSRCNFYTLPFLDGFRWSTPEFIAGLRFQTPSGEKIIGGHPIVDDSTKNELLIRWATQKPKGEFVIKFTEQSASITFSGDAKDGWLLELTSRKDVKTPFVKIDKKKVSCIYEKATYSVIASQGSFGKADVADLQIKPEGGNIKLDFSKR